MARTVEALSPAELREAVAALWRVRPPIQGNLFYQLHDTCCNLYSFRKKPAPQNALSFAISDALSALGFPVHLSREHRDLALSAGVAAARLHTAFTRTQATRIYLSPLNRADDFPELKFGPNRIARLTGAELEELVDLPRLRRINATWTLTKVFSESTWLVIKQTYPLDQTPAERAIPLLFERGGRDWARSRRTDCGFFARRQMPAPSKMRYSRCSWLRGKIGSIPPPGGGGPSRCPGSMKSTMISSAVRRRRLLLTHSLGVPCSRRAKRRFS
jgi:hypothetical protein